VTDLVGCGVDEKTYTLSLSHSFCFHVNFNCFFLDVEICSSQKAVHFIMELAGQGLNSPFSGIFGPQKAFLFSILGGFDFPIYGLL
jgi:hypothetical protein